MRWMAAAWLAIALGVAPTAALGQARLPSEVESAQLLLRQGKAEEAWAILAPLEKQYAGQPEFDLALAMAATDSGRPNRATFALERLVVLQPGNATARLELARAYYALRDYERAERELLFIMEGDPPAEVRALVADYRARMKDLPAAAAPVPAWSGYAEAAVGYDTNPNVAMAQGAIFVPSLGSVLLIDAPFRKDSDTFAALGAGVEYVRALSGSLAATLGADLQMRSHADLTTADWRDVDLRAGLFQRLNARDGLQYTLRHNEYDLDHGHRRVQSAGAEWRRTVAGRARLGIGVQGHRIRYLSDARGSSSDLIGVSASAAHLFDATARIVGLAGLFAGLDNAVAGRADGDRHIFGASAGLQRGLSPAIEGYASLGLLYSRYQDRNPDFGVLRRDRQLELSLGLAWRFAPGWSLRPQMSRTRNASNIPVSDYDRTEASLALRHDWN